MKWKDFTATGPFQQSTGQVLDSDAGLRTTLRLPIDAITRGSYLKMDLLSRMFDNIFGSFEDLRTTKAIRKAMYIPSVLALGAGSWELLGLVLPLSSTVSSLAYLF